jgi:hypothetical protein
MAINVYWACTEKEWIKAEQPEKVLDRFYKLGFGDKEFSSPAAINYCPVFNQTLNNVFAIKSIYDYSFKIEDGNVNTRMYDQEFFEQHLLVRQLEKKFFSFYVKYIFFTDEDSLEITAYEYPVFEQNEITKRCMIFPGKFDIGKWFRNTEFAFALKDEFNEFVVNNEDVLYYLRFHTKEKINFKQFKMTDSLSKIMIDNNKINNFSLKPKRNINDFYNKFKGKAYILNEIKQNLV